MGFIDPASHHPVRSRLDGNSLHIVRFSLFPLDAHENETQDDDTHREDRARCERHRREHGRSNDEIDEASHDDEAVPCVLRLSPLQPPPQHAVRDF